MTKVLQTLVADNEDLKRGNAEVQGLLRESREDVRALQEEVEELRAAMPPPPNREPADSTPQTSIHTDWMCYSGQAIHATSVLEQRPLVRLQRYLRHPHSERASALACVPAWILRTPWLTIPTAARQPRPAAAAASREKPGLLLLYVF